MHDSSKCPFDKQFSQSLFVLTNSFRSSKDNSLAYDFYDTALDASLWNLFISFITFVILFFGLFAVFVNLFLKEVVYMAIMGVFFSVW